VSGGWQKCGELGTAKGRGEVGGKAVSRDAGRVAVSSEVWVGEASPGGDAAGWGWVVSVGGRPGLAGAGLGTARGGWPWGTALGASGGASFLWVLALAVTRGAGSVASP